MIEILFLGFATLCGAGLATTVALNEEENQKAGGRQNTNSGSPEPVQQNEPLPQRPPQQVASGNVVTIQKNANNAFVTTCQISADGAPFTGASFNALIDTGAGLCFINHTVARQFGINPKRLSNDTKIGVGGGRKIAAALAEIDWNVSGIIVRNVKTAILHEEVNGGHNLVGIPFLERCRVQLDGDTMKIAPRR